MPQTGAGSDLLSPDFLARLEQLELASRRVLTGRFKGERLSKRKGTSVEFADYKNYAVGDDLRFLDWSIYARLERLFIKLFLEEEDLRLHLLVDASGSMDFGTPPKFRYACQVAAALGFVALAHLDCVNIHVLGQGALRSLTGLRGRPSVWRMLQFLGQIEPAHGGHLAPDLREFSLRYPHRGVVLLSDLLDKHGYADALRYLLTRPADVYVIHTLAPEELEPALTGDLKLVDIEDADETEITANRELLEQYKANLAAFQEGIQSYCHRRGIVYIAVSTALPVEKLVLHFLRRRGLLR
ncbi:MAG: DUF58 domain-containing protein [Gemmataceae bacterium]